MSEELFRKLSDEAKRHAFLIARGERLAILRGRRARSFDDRGLHPFSMEVARVLLLQELSPALRDDTGFDHLLLKREAEAEALRIYLEEDLAKSEENGPVEQS